MRQFLIYFISSLTCICMVIPQVVFANPVAGVAMAIVTGLDVWMGTQAIEEYQEWRETHPNNPISDFTDSFNGVHRALGVTLDPEGFSGHDGQLPDPSEITWMNNDKSFNDFDSAYQDYVSDLPCGSSYDSTGHLRWSPVTDFGINIETYNPEKIEVTTTYNSVLAKSITDPPSSIGPGFIGFQISSSDVVPVSGTHKPR